MFSFIKKLNSSQRTLLFACFFAFFCNGSQTLMMGSVMPDLKLAYSLSDTLSGLFISAHSVGNWVAGFVSGLIPLYLGQKKSIVLLSFLSAIGFLMMLVFGNPAWLFMAFAMVGLGRGSVTNFDNRTVNALSGGSPAASNLLHASFAIGAILAPMAFLVLSRLFSWRAGCVYIACLCILSILNLSQTHMDNDRPDRKDRSARTLEFLKNRSFLILALMMFCYLCSEYSINGWLVTYIQNKSELLSSFRAEGEALAAAVQSYSQSMATLLWCVILVGRLLCATLSARISQKKLMMISSFGVVLFFSLMLFSSTIPAVTFSVAGLGFCMAGICPMIYSDAAVFTNAYPMATSMLLGIGSTGAILMPTVVGALADRLGFTGGMSAILVTVVLLAVFSTLNAFMKPRLPE